MGPRWYPCKDCDETWCDCGEYRQCVVCDGSACMGCAEDWHRVNDRDNEPHYACHDCRKVQVKEREVFNELLRRYRALPGSQALDFDFLHQQLAQGRATAYDEWKDQDDVQTDGDDSASEGDPGTEEEEEEDEEDDDQKTAAEDGDKEAAPEHGAGAEPDQAAVKRATETPDEPPASKRVCVSE